MAFLQYFSTNIPGLSVSCKVQCLPLDHLFSKSNFHVLQQGLKCSELFPKGQQKALQETGRVWHSWVSAAATWECQVFPLGEAVAGLRAAVDTPLQQHSKLQQSRITPTKGIFGVAQEQSEVSDAAARAGCDHKTLCKVQKAAW